MSFNAFIGSATRGAPVSRGSGPLLRGSAPRARFDATFDPQPALIDKDDTLIITTEERPPPLPYSTWEVCSTNTFTCSDPTTSPQALKETLKGLIRKSPADISCNSEWQFDAVFYPQETKTTFKVSFFENASEKNSCLVEVDLQEGDRYAFQSLVSYLKSKAKLTYAFADEWGFEDDDEEMDDEWEGGYQHTTFAPLPLPSALLAKLDKLDTSKVDTAQGSLVDVLLQNSCSPFADVRHSGWQDLANSSNEREFAKTLIDARIYGQECISYATAVLKEDATCEMTVNTQRCVLKTLLNIAKTENVDACRKIYGLKSEILEIANDFKIHSTEARVTAMELMQSLSVHNKCMDKEFEESFKHRSHGKCRASDFARTALTSLKVISM